MKLMGHTRMSNTRNTLNLKVQSQPLCPKTQDYSLIVPGKNPLRKIELLTTALLQLQAQPGFQVSRGTAGEIPPDPK